MNDLTSYAESHIYQSNGNFKIKNQSGFALPSVLFIATIVTVLIFSIIVLLYLRSKETLIEISRTKALNAATSGIEKSINEIDKGSIYNSKPTYTQFQFTFDDGGISNVEVIPWGGYILFQSNGTYGKSKKQMSAIAGYYPPAELSNALIFNNDEHQLILTGNAQITGDVIVGSREVTVGTLRDYQTPRRIPIDGNIKRQTLNGKKMYDVNEYLNSLKKTEDVIKSRNTETSDDFSMLDVGNISPGQKYFHSSGNCSISGSLEQENDMLMISTEGSMTLSNVSISKGFIFLKAKGGIHVLKKSQINNVILFSEDSIYIGEGVSFTGQVFSPKIRITSQSKITYPSLVCVIPSQKHNSLLIESSATVEGTIIISSKEESSQFVFETGSVIYGGIYSEAGINFNATLYGTLITTDFSFYDAPTQYFGWLRQGEINRTLLPDGYMIPYGFSTQSHLGIIDWQ